MHTIPVNELISFCDNILQPQEFRDYCPNGLQVDADTPISKIITGVTANQALIDQAIAKKAQAILVHHGYFWKGEAATLTGIKGKRIRSLLQNNISLIAYHLPLDAHPQIGNNAVLAKELDLVIDGGLFAHEKFPVGNIAHHQPITAKDFAQKITQVLGRIPLHLSQNPNRTICKIGICTGGAQDYIEQAYLMGCDAYISGEVSERTTHFAQEMGIDYFACGHHATERGGIRELGLMIAQKLGIKNEFIDIYNPV